MVEEGDDEPGVDGAGDVGGGVASEVDVATDVDDEPAPSESSTEVAAVPHAAISTASIDTRANRCMHSVYGGRRATPSAVARVHEVFIAQDRHVPTMPTCTESMTNPCRAATSDSASRTSSAETPTVAPHCSHTKW